jgi:putative ABC transport system permease protein
MFPDFKFALRRLAKSPGFTATAILTLALGIGLNTSMFSLMNLLILKPLPYPAVNELVRIDRTTPQSKDAAHSASDFLELTRETADFAQLAAFRQWGYTLMPEGRASVNLNSLRVSAGFLPTLGLKPELGRFFTPEEDQPGNHVVILSHDTWQAHFGGDPAVVGSTVRIDGESTTVVGVMPADFSSVFLWGPADALRPLALTTIEKENLGEMSLSLIARRSAALTPEQLQSRLGTVAQRLAEFRPKDRAEDGLRAVSLEAVARTPATVGLSWMMVGLAGAVLAIACANLANLQLARAVARAHEFAIRAALGASRSRLLRPILSECLLLAIGGGALGVLIALWTNDWISSRLSAHGFFRLTLELDWRVMSFAFAASLVTGIAFGLLPAWLLTRVRVNDSLKSGGRGHTGDRTQHRVQHSLIVIQFANALILLAGATGFIREIDRLVSVNPGWQQGEIIQAVLNLPPAKYATPAQTYSFYQQLEERLAALPGAEGATVGWTLPVYQYLTMRSLIIEGQPAPAAGHEPNAYINGVAPTFFTTLGVPVTSGRSFTANDTLTSVPVGMINASMARALFPGEDPVGRLLGSPDPKNPGWFEIVGVVPDLGMAVGGVPQRTQFQVYRPLAQETWNYVTVAIRSRQPAALAQSMRQAITDLDPNLALQQFGTISEVTKVVTGSVDMFGTVLVAFALLGLFLAAIGLYGVISHLVARRTMEIGVRVALGAQARDVLWMVLRSGLRLTALGTALGLVGAVALGFGIAALMEDAATNDPVIFVGVTAVLLVVGLLATWLPARRATKVDPMVALRAE